MIAEVLMKKMFLGLALLLLLSAENADQKKALEQFDQAVKAAEALKDCQMRFKLYAANGKNNEMNFYSVQEGKYIHHPLYYYQRRDEVQASYKEQGGVGFQEIYRGDQDITEVLMPGAFRALGIVRLLPEDPKGYGMNGGNLKSMAPWDAMERFDRMAKKGKVTMSTATLNNKPYTVFEIVQNPGTYFIAGINRAKVFVDPQTNLINRFEQFRPGQEKPCAWSEYENLRVNTGITPEQLSFEGFKSPFSLVKSPPGSEVDPLLTPVVRNKVAEPAPDTQAILEKFNKATDGINSYRADLAMRFRYKRLRLYREDRYAYNRKPYWFTLVTTAQKADYILLNHSAGAVLWIEPSDNSIHIIGGGVQRILGEQVFSGTDYKFFSTLGDNPYELSFPNIQALLKGYFAGGKTEAWTVDYKGKKMWELQVTRAGEVWEHHPGKINLVIDPENNLPRVVQLSGYDDPRADMTLTVDNLKLNPGIKPGETKF
jgi:hypothetical protein